MDRIEEKVTIKCSADKAFDYMIEAKNWPRWLSFMKNAEQTAPGQVTVGTTFKGTIHMMGLDMKWTAKATEYQPNEWSKHITSGNIGIDEHVICAPIEDGTQSTLRFDMNVGGFYRLFRPMIVSTMRKETKRSLNSLKDILEAKN